MQLLVLIQVVALLALFCPTLPALAFGLSANHNNLPTSESAFSAGSSRRHVLQTASVASAGLLPLPQKSATAAAATTAVNTIHPVTTLADGKTKFPLASFGLQIYSDETAYQLTLTALEVGYRNFFASVLARNQRGFARAVRDSGIPRSELFICGSVISNRVQGFQAAKDETTAGWKRNMDAFGVGGIDYLDQIMLDYPGPDAVSILGQWASFQEMHQQKLTRTLSVSNFNPAQLDCILQAPTTDKFQFQVPPLVNQLPYSVAYHPNINNEVEENTRKRNILVQAWAPLGGSLMGRFDNNIKQKCADIGKKYNKSFAQVALRWIVQSGASFTTQSQNKKHFQEDLHIFDFELSEDDMKVLSRLA